MPADDKDKSPNHAARIFGVGLGVLFGAPFGFLIGFRNLGLLAFVIFSGWLVVYFIRWFSSSIAENTANLVLRMVWPSGDSTPYAKTYSREQALAARGDRDGAFEAYEMAMALNPEDPEPRIQAAELHFRGKTPDKAVPLFVEARRLSGDNRARELYATQRLIDLYLGPLNNPPRALVELRRLVERFPGTREAESARAAIVKLKPPSES